MVTYGIDSYAQIGYRSIFGLLLATERQGVFTSPIQLLPKSSDLPTSPHRDTSTFDFYDSIKRLIDIVVALFGLLLLAFVLPIFVICVFCEDHGPIFYRQVRIGQYGKPFVIYKLRTMVPGADSALNQIPELASCWREKGKIRDDPRVTRTGQFFRRISLDELPQMLNILCGQMSLVGPRAMQPAEDEVLGELIALRREVKPGMTGLWQVCGRSLTTYEQRGILDCMYVMERSCMMDLAILLHTFPVVVRGIGAC
jgi:exopolysaccharide production protein ExoY